MNVPRDGKVSLPVAPAHLIYSYLKNVSGVPAADGNPGVTLNKLNILDVLIEQMNRLRGSGGKAFNFDITENGTTAAIEGFLAKVAQNKTHKAPYIPVPLAETGLLFNLSV